MPKSVPKSSRYDVVVIGAGPAGLSAAMNVANRKRTVAVFDGVRPFSYARRAPQIPNYPGFTFATGEELAESFLEHVERFEVPLFEERVTRVLPAGDELYLSTDADTYTAGAVILATGLYRAAEIEGEAELVGRGVSYCVNCDGRLYAGREVAVVGYAPEGEEEASSLAEDMNADVTYLPLYEGDYDVPEDVTVLTGHRPDRLVRADNKVRVVLPDQELLVDGVFIYKESVSPRSILDGLTYDGRHIQVDRRGETAVEGVFAAGDVTGEPYQIAKAVGEGQVAALQAVRRVREIEKRASGSSGAPATGSSAGTGGAKAASAGDAEEKAADEKTTGRASAERETGEAEPRALSEEDRRNLIGILERMQEPVRLVHVTQLADEEHPGVSCSECDEARRLIGEFSDLSPKIELEMLDFMRDHDRAEAMGVERIPATLAAGIREERPRVRFFGVPAGYEFAPFLDAVLELSRGDVRLADETHMRLAELDRSVHIEVMTTPTCPKCPAAVRLAHRFAMASPRVTSDMIVATEFPELAHQYEVASVPLVVIDGEPVAPGVLDEARLLELLVGDAET